MCDESTFIMDKKVPARQSPCPARNNGEKKSDYLSTKNGRPKKHRDNSNNGRPQDSAQQAARPAQKYGRGFSDKRPRQRGYSDRRQSEEITDLFEVDIDFLTPERRKGNANHLLNFSYQHHSHYGSPNGTRGSGSWGGRKAYRHHTPSYKKEQYLQASCQFIVEDGGDYSQQAIDPDALVDWEKVELVRTFSTQLVICPICLDVPVAAKITRCGHTYCWACILHYLQVDDSSKKDPICPVCPERIDADKLRSVQNITVPDYKVGDEIEMKLMRKSKGSVFVCPEGDWTGSEEGHLNVNAGDRAKYPKLLLASWQQVKSDVIDVEKEALGRALLTAEQEEICFLQMAQQLLQERESSLLLGKVNSVCQSGSKTGDITEISTQEKLEAVEEAKPELPPLPPDVSFDGSKISIVYTDAFGEEDGKLEEKHDHLADEKISVWNLKGESFSISEDEDREREVDPHKSPSPGGSETAKGASPDQSSPIADIHETLTPEEAADHLELPDMNVSRQLRSHGTRSKDTYHFYQASSGQHIYMHSLNAQCLTSEYGSLESSPRTVTATVVAIERIFMTEEMRKRLRYLNHIPLTTEFHVVELKIKPPVLSKETLKRFQPDFDKRRKFRQRKAKEEKARASKHEVEYQKAHGIYIAPEIHIPLDNTAHFPGVCGLSERQRKESTNSDIFPDTNSGASDGQGSPVAASPTYGDSLGTSPSFASFAQKLRGNSIDGTSPPAWPRISPSLVHSATMPEMRGHNCSVWGAPQEEDAEGGEAYNAPSMASAWLASLHDLAPEPQNPSATAVDGVTSPANEPSTGGKKKKKKKEKQLLFSTSMARKN